MPRPTVDEKLATEIRRIHRETHDGESAGSLQEALDTVVQLALKEANMEGQTNDETDSWYPGKYAGEVVDRLVGNSDGTHRAERRSERQPLNTGGSSIPHRSPDDTAIFKTRLSEDGTVTIPDAEVDALEFETGDILQIFAYNLANNTDE